MARLIHLNGPPGIGKSTIARRYVDDHPGVLNCDIDILRGLVGGSQRDFGPSGALIRPAALALITAYLRGGHDVVLPQLLARVDELAKFEAAAAAADASFLEIVLMDEPDSLVSRFHRRGSTEPGEAWHGRVREIVAASGGDELLASAHAYLLEVLAQRPSAVVIDSVEGEIEATYRSVMQAVSDQDMRDAAERSRGWEADGRATSRLDATLDRNEPRLQE